MRQMAYREATPCQSLEVISNFEKSLKFISVVCEEGGVDFGQLIVSEFMILGQVMAAWGILWVSLLQAWMLITLWLSSL